MLDTKKCVRILSGDLKMRTVSDKCVVKQNKNALTRTRIPYDISMVQNGTGPKIYTNILKVVNFGMDNKNSLYLQLCQNHEHANA